MFTKLEKPNGIMFGCKHPKQANLFSDREISRPYIFNFVNFDHAHVCTVSKFTIWHLTQFCVIRIYIIDIMIFLTWFYKETMYHETDISYLEYRDTMISTMKQKNEYVHEI